MGEISGKFPAGTEETLPRLLEKCFRTLFPDSPLDDGSAITAYDAVVTAVTAIRLGKGINDRPKLIIREFNRIHRYQAAAGASGWISLGESGKPINKAVPILEVRPDGAVVFVKLSAPLGVPRRPDAPALC